MADIAEVRDAIADRLSSIPGLRGLKTVSGEITPPAALVLLSGIDYDSTMSRGSDDLVFVATVVVSKSHERAGQDALYAYMNGAGAQSVKAAFEADHTLGGLVMDCAVSQARAPGEITIGEIAYYGVEFILPVSVSGL